MHFQNWGLKKKYSMYFGAVVIPMIVISVLVYHQTTIAVENRAIEEASDRLEKNEQNLLSILATIETMSGYMIYDDKFRTFFTTPSEEAYGPTYNNIISGIKGYFTFQIISNAFINSILLIGKDNQTMEYGEPVSGDEDSLTRKAQEAKGSPVWSSSYQVFSGWGGEKQVISLSRVINDVTNINQPIGLIRIRLNQNKLYNSIEVPSEHVNYFVISKQGEVILHQDSSMVGEYLSDAELVDWVINGEERSYYYQRDNQRYLVVKNTMRGTDWLSVGIIDHSALISDLYHVRTLLGYMIGSLILASIVFFVVFYRSSVQKIIDLTKQTKQVEKGDFTASVHVKSKDEIGKLGMRFNSMVKTIRRLIETEYKLKIKQKESELKALQNQMDPHFLYNTLDMIRWTARLENALETGQQIEDLSKIFRMNLNNGKTWLTVKEEMDYMDAYLKLQKNRLGDNLNYHVFLDYQIEESFVMKQVVQPLVENSIVHGFKDLSRPGKIIIRSYRKNDQIWIDVIDNGHGLPAELLEKEPPDGHALNNLKDRLSIAFGEHYGLKFLDSDEGAFVRLVLPYLDEESLKKCLEKLGD